MYGVTVSFSVPAYSPPRAASTVTARLSLDQVRREIGVDSLAYLSIEGLYRAVGEARRDGAGYCDACFSGDYQIRLVDHDDLNTSANADDQGSLFDEGQR